MSTWFLEGYLYQAEKMHRVVIDAFPFVIGRGKESDLTLNYTQISRTHCTLQQDRPDTLTVRDNHSTNGTPGQVTLSWSDNADNETRYDVQRAEGGAWETIATLGPDAQGFVDETVASLTTYQYRVLAGNSAGDAASDSIQITSADQVAPNITLSASGYKTKGWQNVDASWDAGGATVVLYRDSTRVYSGSNSAYTDSRISKGGAVYTYQVCPQGQARGSEGCSNTVQVVF